MTKLLKLSDKVREYVSEKRGSIDDMLIDVSRTTAWVVNDWLDSQIRETYLKTYKTGKTREVPVSIVRAMRECSEVFDIPFETIRSYQYSKSKAYGRKYFRLFEQG